MSPKAVVIVTGASRGVGAGVADWLVRSGSAVVLVARSADTLRSVAETLEQKGGAVLALPADVSDAKTCRRVMAETEARYGRLDALVNNAGTVAPLAMTVDADPAAWEYCLRVNLAGPFFMCREAVPLLRRQRGRVINISSGAAQKVIKGAGAYCSAKAGLNHFTSVLAAEEPRITAVAVRPGVVDTDMQRDLRRKGPGAMPEETAGYYARLKEEGRLEPPWLPARSIAWLALAAPADLSGRFVNYDDPEIGPPARRMFGDP